ncbi:MAG: hypothetical protein RI973_846 [Bacteroidota bacterium]|jgi:gliding motility-associated-like protein
MKKHLLVFLGAFIFSSQLILAQCPPPGYPQTGDMCMIAPVLCNDLDGYCATLGTNNQQQPFPGCGGSVLNNDEWFAFIAGSTQITIQITPSNCQGTNGQFGMQGALYEGSCGGTAIATQCNCTTDQFTFSYSNFIVGNTYYLVFDGCSGDICDFSVDVLDGSTVPVPPSPPSAILGATSVCPGATSTYTVPIPNASTYTWSVTPSSMGSIVSPNPGGAIDIVWNNVGSAQICVSASNECFPPTAPICITVNSQNIPPTYEPAISICLGDCAPCAGTLFCGPTPASGTPVTLTNWQGCDSVVICTIKVIPPITGPPVQTTFCAPYTYSVCGESYNASTFGPVTCENWQGCDSTFFLDLAILEPLAEIEQPGVLGCGTSSTITLNGANSSFALVPNGQTTFQWTGPGITGPTNQVVATVNQPGQYCLTVTHSRNGVNCSNTKCVTVTQNIQVPQQPLVAGNQNPCQGTSLQYTVTPVGSPSPTGYTWTTPNGQPITQVNPTTISVNWNNATGGQLCVTANNACGASTPACIPININALPASPAISGPSSICGGNSGQVYTIGNPQPGVTYAWTVPAGASFSGSGSSITVNYSGVAQGPAQVCATATNACGNTQFCYNVVVTSPPLVPTLSGPTSVCSSNPPAAFSVSNALVGTSFNWTVPTGAVINGSGANITVDFSNAVSGQVCATAENGCGSTAPTCQAVQVTQAPAAQISGSGSFCAGDTSDIILTINITGSGPWNIGYSINGGAPVSITVPSSPYDLLATQAGTYTLTSVETSAACAGTVSGSAEVIENPAPTAILSGMGTICQGSGQTDTLDIELTGSAPWTVGWSVNGAAQAPLQVNSSPYSLVIGQSQAGNISLTSVVDANGCNGTASGTGTVVVNTAPVVSGISITCDATNTNYVVTFSISSGDPSSYSVTPLNGTLTGNQFTSNSIPSGDGYNFDVTDANACAVINVSDNAVVCDCTTQAGTMDQAPVLECGDGPVTVDYDDTNEVLDGDDVQVFILHSGSGLNIIPPIVAVSTSPEVSFNPANMTYGTTYHFSAVVGDSDGNGSVDLDDDCLSVAQGTPVTFYEVPTATLSGEVVICQGENAALEVALTGESPWSISYNDGGGAQTINGITANPYNLTLSPQSTASVTLSAVSDVNCAGTTGGEGEITVNTEVEYSNLSVVCNGTNTAYTISFSISGGDPSSYAVTGVAGTISNGVFTSSPLPTGTGFSLTLDDANSCDPKVITQSLVICNCSTEAGQMQLNAIKECGDGPVAVPAAVGTVLDADDMLRYYLHTSSSNVLGTVIAVSNQPSFSFDPASMTYGVTYYLSAVAGSDDGSGSINLSDPCLSVSPGTPLTFYDVPTVSMTGGVEICPGESTDLTFELTGDSPWSVTVNGQVVSGIVGTPYNYTVTPSSTTDYVLTAVNDEFCSATTNQTQTVTVHQPPTVANVEATCNATATGYVLCFDIQGGDSAGYEVSPATGTLNGSQFCSDEITAGNGYNFSVTDGHGCPAVIVQQDAVACDCISQSGFITLAPITVCGNTMTVPPAYNQSTQTLDANDALCFVLHAGDYQPKSTNSSGLFTFNPATMVYGQQYFISAVVGDDNGSGCVNLNDPCVSFSSNLPVTFYEVPSATISGDNSICQGSSTPLTINFTGDGPFSFSYTGVSGNPVNGQTSANPHTINVAPSQTAFFSLLSMADEHCSGNVNGNVLITVNAEPTTFGTIATCDPTNTTYTVTFEILGGDPATYTVSPAGNLSGGTFVSNPILSGTPYSFSVDDVNGCGPAVVSGNLICDCTTDAGTMSGTLVSVCGNGAATAVQTSPANFDANDALVYILHTNSGASLGTVLATSSTPTFNFLPGQMSYGVQYYISAVAGNSNGAGGIQANDPCLSVAPGTPVIFRQLPSATASGTTSICEGGSATISLTLNGVGPFNLVYSQNGSNQTLPVPAPGSSSLPLSPSSTTTITLISVQDLGTGCSSPLSQTVTITVNPPPDAGTSLGDLSFCGNVVQIVDLDNQLTGADPVGSWSGPLGPVPGGQLNIASLSPGTYTFVYTVEGSPPCEDDESFVTIDVADVPVADAGANQELNCDVSSVTLGGAGTTSGAIYLWTGGALDDPTAQNPVVTIPGTYTLTVSNAAGCSSTDQITVTQSITSPVPFVSVNPVSCFGRTDGLAIVDSVSNGDAPYLYSLNGAAYTSQAQFFNLAAGDYELAVIDAAGCENKSVFTILSPEEVTAQIDGGFSQDDPVINLGDELELILISNPSFFQLDTVIWSEGGLDSCAYCAGITVAPTDQTTYTVTIEKGGCRTTALLTVFVKKDRPVYIPNAFSPNDDGINDLLTVFGGKNAVKVHSFLVFNRWGETVFEHYNFSPNDPSIGWDGRHRGQFLNPGVFTWIAEIEFLDGSVELYEGAVNLIR